MIPKVFHLLATAYYVFIAYSTTQVDLSKVTHPDLLALDKYRLRFFTGWNIMLQVLAFSICVFDDVFSLTPANFLAKFKSKLTSLKSYIFLGLAFPSSMLVALVFWGPYHFDRDTIYPAIMDTVIPLWLNHAMHTSIMLIAGLEILFTQHYCSTRKGLIGINIFLGIFETCLLTTFFTQGDWLYPLFKLFTWPQVFGFGVLLHLAASGFFFLGSAASSSLWRNVSKKENKQSKQQSKQESKPQSKQQKQKAKQSQQKAKQSPQPAKNQSPKPTKQPSPQQPKQVTKQQPKQQSPQAPKQQQSPQAPKQVSKQSPQQPKQQTKQNGNTVISKKKEKMK